jgi:hypothetical protein
MDLAQIDQLTGPLEAFAGLMTAVMATSYSDMWRAQRKSARFWHNTLWDLGHFCEVLETTTTEGRIKGAAGAVQSALDQGEGRFVLSESHSGPKVQQCRGVTVYLVPPISTISRYYRELDFTLDHSWIGMLEAYHDA